MQNCGFETPVESPGNYVNFGPGAASITGWTVVTTPPGGVDLTTKTFAGGFPVHGGVQSLDLNHDNPGGISQTIATTAGQPYQLSFFLSGYLAGAAPCSASDPKMLTVTAASASANYSFTPDPHASPPGNQQFARETLAFTGAGGSSTTLTFTGTNSGCAGPIIDDVIVVPGP